MLGSTEVARRDAVTIMSGSRAGIRLIAVSTFSVLAGGNSPCGSLAASMLAARDPHGLFPPASTLKVLTAISLIPALDPDMMVTASRRATSVEPNIVGLARGHSYRVADLFRALLLISANDAAVALTQATGSYSRGIGLMNAEAHWLHADDVVARNPNGLPA